MNGELLMWVCLAVFTPLLALAGGVKLAHHIGQT